MSRTISFEKVDPNIEQLIITGLILSTDFTRDLLPLIKNENFKGDHTRVIAQWCLEYFKEFKKAPGKSIVDIFNIKKETENFNEDDEDSLVIIKKILENIASSYKEEGSFNQTYIFRKAVKYLSTNALDYKLNKAIKLSQNGEIKSALTLIRDLDKELLTSDRELVDFPNLGELKDVYHSDRKSLFRFPGELGRYMGDFRRGKFISFLGPTKRGKTHWLLEFAIQALFAGLKVFFFSLELKKVDILELLMMRFLNKEISEYYNVGKYLIPVFDCVHNQTGDCILDECTSPDSCVIDEDTGNIMEWEEDIDHIPCTECLKHEDLKENYEISSWFTLLKQKTIKSIDIDDLVYNFNIHFNGSLKIKAYPISTATPKDLINDLDLQEAYNNWIPDVVVIDSLDNFKKNTSLGDKRFQLSDIWEEISKLTNVRNYCTATATQGNRGSFAKDRLEATDVAEDWSKAQILDALFAINEKGNTIPNIVLKDKYWKRQYIETLLHRFQPFVSGRQCCVLNNFDLGQICLDSAITHFKHVKGGL